MLADLLHISPLVSYYNHRRTHIEVPFDDGFPSPIWFLKPVELLEDGLDLSFPAR